MNHLTTPERMITFAQPGTMIYANIIGETGPEIAMLIREDTPRIQAFGPSPRIALRTALFIEQGVGLIPILVGVGKPPELYESWLNIHQTGATVDHLAVLAEQKAIKLLFYGDGGKRERAIEVPNNMGGTFGYMRQRITELPPWSMERFGAARDVLYRRYPNVKKLWKALV